MCTGLSCEAPSAPKEENMGRRGENKSEILGVLVEGGPVEGRSWGPAEGPSLPHSPQFLFFSL